MVGDLFVVFNEVDIKFKILFVVFLLLFGILICFFCFVELVVNIGILRVFSMKLYFLFVNVFNNVLFKLCYVYKILFLVFILGCWCVICVNILSVCWWFFLLFVG